MLEEKDCQTHGPYRVYDNELTTCPDCYAGHPPPDPERLRIKRLEFRANAQFGRQWHSITTIVPQQDQGAERCYWCNKPSEGRTALVNIWGNVCVTPACFECYTKHDGKMRDDL